MKKKYVTPLSETYNFVAENMLATSGDTMKLNSSSSDEMKADYSLSNKKVWNSTLWADED